MGDVVGFGGESRLPIPVEKVLRGALESHEEEPFDRVIVIAVHKNGIDEFYATSESDAGTHLWDIARFHRRLMLEADKRMEES